MSRSLNSGCEKGERFLHEALTFSGGRLQRRRPDGAQELRDDVVEPCDFLLRDAHGGF